MLAGVWEGCLSRVVCGVLKGELLELSVTSVVGLSVQQQYYSTTLFAVRPTCYFISSDRFIVVLSHQALSSYQGFTTWNA